LIARGRSKRSQRESRRIHMSLVPFSLVHLSAVLLTKRMHFPTGHRRRIICHCISLSLSKFFQLSCRWHPTLSSLYCSFAFSEHSVNSIKFIFLTNTKPPPVFIFIIINEATMDNLIRNPYTIIAFWLMVLLLLLLYLIVNISVPFIVRKRNTLRTHITSNHFFFFFFLILLLWVMPNDVSF